MTNFTWAWMYGLQTYRTCCTPLRVPTDKKSAVIHAINDLCIITHKVYLLCPTRKPVATRSQHHLRNTQPIHLKTPRFEAHPAHF